MSWVITKNNEHDWTLIVADDGSTDGTQDWLRGWTRVPSVEPSSAPPSVHPAEIISVDILEFNVL